MARNARYQVKTELKVIQAKKLEQKKAREILAIEAEKQRLAA